MILMEVENALQISLLGIENGNSDLRMEDSVPLNDTTKEEAKGLLQKFNIVLDNKQEFINELSKSVCEYFETKNRIETNIGIVGIKENEEKEIDKKENEFIAQLAENL